MNTFDDDNMFLRHIREQLRQNQIGEIENTKLLNSLNRPMDVGPWKTQVVQGNPGAFSPSMPLNFPGSNIPKTSMPNSAMDKFIAMQPPRGQIDAFTRQQEQKNPNMVQQVSDAPINLIKMIIKSLMGK